MAAAAVLLPPVTPPTYHRIVSETLRVPFDEKVSIPVGLLACQRDPLLREIATTVVSARISQAPTPPSNGRKSKKEKAPPVPSEPLLEVVLHDTVIFPEGGGQPSDIGVLTSSDGELWDVIEAKRHGGHAVHYVRSKDQSADRALRSFSPGAKVGVALGDEGWRRRLDHMCMHTSQHLLSAVLDTRNLPTLSWSLTAWPTPSYVEIPRSMSADEIASVQDEANRLVFEGRSVHVEVEELHDENMPDQAKLESGRNVGKALPADYTGGVKRTVIIDGVDRSPCCGTHPPTIHNLQLFLLPHTESLARASTASARLYFLAGPRLLHHLGAVHAHLARTAAALSCGAPQVPERVEQVAEERKRAGKRVDDVEAELAGLLARDLVGAVVGAGGAGAVMHRHRTDDAANPLGFLNAISMAFAREVAARPDAPPYLVVLSSSPSAQTAASTSVVLVFGSDEARVKEAGDALKAKLNVKGGGKGRWSGKFTGVWREKESRAVEEALAPLSGVNP
ncbi:ThrRS/AlaRS common domain-containing protein [Daedalea quercina L-15889]|uniref:ThrRS/AlaRS common domain-containing protein n=1 Tax=Daedalea quercina L-15889 TaxID=1314783 RepID=A0A165SUX6_9APHY|nr:ThrRS/AlaRS common domain-containing protein [Daedalea quercina L-15889]